jgi:hypothetical protein
VSGEVVDILSEIANRSYEKGIHGRARYNIG